jgi:hypothetical protein
MIRAINPYPVYYSPVLYSQVQPARQNCQNHLHNFLILLISKQYINKQITLFNTPKPDFNYLTHFFKSF